MGIGELGVSRVNLVSYEGGSGSKFEVALWDPSSEASLRCDCEFTIRLRSFRPWFYTAVIPHCFAVADSHTVVLITSAVVTP